MYVTNRKGQPIPLTSLLDISEDAPSTLFHFNRYRSATISAGLAEGKTIGDGIREIQAIADSVLKAQRLPSPGLPAIMRKVPAMALLCVLPGPDPHLPGIGAQFESFIDPFTIMMTVPLALAGALISLWLFDQTINIFHRSA